MKEQNNKTDTDNFEELIDKHGLSEPLSRETQEFIKSRQNDVLKNVLKKAGKYSFFTGLILIVYNVLKKIGISYFLTKLIVTAVAVVSVSSAAYISVKYVIDKQVGQENTEIHIQEVIKEIEQDKLHKGKAEKIPGNFIVGINAFDSADDNKEALEFALKTIKNGLNRLKGNRFAKIITSNKDRSVKYIVAVSVQEFKFENKFCLKAQMINTETYKIEYSTTKIVNSKKELNKNINQIPQEILGKIR